MTKSVSLKRGMLWNACGSLVFLGCQWLTTVFVVRLSPDYSQAGALAIAMAVSNIFVPIALYKIRSFQVSDIQHVYTAGDYVTFRIATIIVGLLAAGLYMFISCAPSDYPIVFAYVVFRACDIFIDVLHGVDQCNARMDLCGKSMIIRGVLFLISFVAVMGITGNAFLAVISMSIVSYPFILLDWKWASRFEDLTPTFRWDKLVSLAMACLPVVIGMVFCSAVTTVARQYFASIFGNDQLGVYASVCTPAVIIQAGASYIYAPLLGIFAEQCVASKWASFERLLLKVSLSIILIAFISLAGAYLFGGPFLSMVFGESIAPYASILYAALICTAATAFQGFLSDLTIALRLMKENLVGNVLSFIAVLALMLFLVPLWSMNGLSLSITVAYLIGSAVMLLYVLSLVKKGMTNRVTSSDATSFFD